MLPRSLRSVYSYMMYGSMTDIRKARAAILTNRVSAMKLGYKMKWSRRDQLELVARLLRVMDAGEGVDDVDLRCLVRIYNREVIGVRNATLND